MNTDKFVWTKDISKNKVCVLVTGGCGFIASNFINRLLKTSRYIVINVDKLYYCSNKKNVILNNKDDYYFYKGDINNTDLINILLVKHRVNIIYNFAAQTHVDNSFGNSLQFVRDNVMGTASLLECARNYHNSVTGKREFKRFIHVSTDEVYGDVSAEKEDLIMEYGLYRPTNPYAATKAAAELLVKSYAKSYKLPIIITRSNNVYGPRQYWEKIIPKFIYLLSQDKKCTIYGDGSPLRKYLYVEDACDAYQLIMEKGKNGIIYEMGSDVEISAYSMALKLISSVKKLDITNDEKEIKEWINFVPDRDFHDTRYIVNNKTLINLGWKQTTNFEKGFKETVDWYLNFAIPIGYWDKDNK